MVEKYIFIPKKMSSVITLLLNYLSVNLYSYNVCSKYSYY